MSELSVISHCFARGEIVTFEDGFEYYSPEGTHGGLSAHNLREIADYLDLVNKPWSDQIDEYFKNEQV